MPRQRDTRYFGSQAFEPQGLGKERKSRDARRRRLEREVFESAVSNLDRPLLRPLTGTPLNPDADLPANPHAPNNSGGPIVLPPVTFTDDDLQEW